jgi:solute:Na+ symporter, SSS family
VSLGFFVGLYLLLNIVIGVVAARLVRGSHDFINANRRLPFMLSSMALFALWYGSETVFGASSEFMQHGLLGVIEDPFGGFLCLMLFGLFLVRPLYRRNLLTLGDLFRNAYGPRIESVAAFCMILTFIGYIAAQLVALSLLFAAVFGMDTTTGLLLSATIVTFYTAAGGMWAISLTDFVQSIVIVVGLLLLCIYLTGLTDFATVMTPPAPGFFDFVPSRSNGVSWLEYLAAWMTLGLGSLASQDIFQRANAARTESIAVLSTLVGACLYLVFAMLPLYLGLVVYQLEPGLLEGDTQQALLALVAAHAPYWLQVMFYGALISAIFSTCSGALLAPSSILAENLIKPLFLQDAEDRSLLWASRGSVLVMAVLATGLARISGNIFELVAESSILGAVSILVPMLFALFGQRHSRLGALLSMLVGLTGYWLFAYGDIGLTFPPLLAGLLASVVGMFLGRVLPSQAVIVKSYNKIQ